MPMIRLVWFNLRYLPAVIAEKMEPGSPKRML